jgi:hypothetical protein
LKRFWKSLSQKKEFLPDLPGALAKTRRQAGCFCKTLVINKMRILLKKADGKKDVILNSFQDLFARTEMLK